MKIGATKRSGDESMTLRRIFKWLAILGGSPLLLFLGFLAIQPGCGEVVALVLDRSSQGTRDIRFYAESVDPHVAGRLLWQGQIGKGEDRRIDVPLIGERIDVHLGATLGDGTRVQTSRGIKGVVDYYPFPAIFIIEEKRIRIPRYRNTWHFTFDNELASAVFFFGRMIVGVLACSLHGRFPRLGYQDLYQDLDNWL